MSMTPTLFGWAAVWPMALAARPKASNTTHRDILFTGMLLKRFSIIAYKQQA
jgi:hypothetical protein